MLAVDHGYFLGPTSGLETPAATIAPLAPYADTLMLTRGVLRSSVDPRVDVPIVLRVSGGTSILSELSNEGLVTAVEDAVRLKQPGWRSIYVGSPTSGRHCLARGVGRRRRAPRSVLAVTAVATWRATRYLRSRAASRPSWGASSHHYCDNFEHVARTCPCRSIAGGKKPEKEALELAAKRCATARAASTWGATSSSPEPGGDDPGGARRGARGRLGGPGLRALQVAAEAQAEETCGQAARGEDDGGEEASRPRRQVAVLSAV
jgi:DhnA family fructose-bisphosphate aldolase class Ia